ncbi:BamA/TamA family outer membrane protein [Formosa maritima]|uniref:Glyceraldehyde-3-phosphate dehydrogenase n=1 Tax=Formosa maritima TaxID=2592046 RepID=A0A5D0GMR5_9FLAO|nr:glyceraldehyde-3-phosphate dehydrogenase [Formosa maritima]TYA58997.1 glyceraldehyde-3-phosphate dehydrogenase [Formosa maritima]
MKFKILLCILLLIVNAPIYSQVKKDDKKNKEKVKISLKDTLDGKLDASEFLIKADGFIPAPQIITQQALGRFGLLITPIFIKPNKHQVKGHYTPPDITAPFIGYTLNKSWFVGGMRMAHLPQYGLKYRVGLAYANVNMDFYRTLPQVGEQEFSFNFKSTPIFMSVMKEVIKNSNLYIGIEYLFMHSSVSPEFDFTNLPGFLNDKDFKSNLSYLGIGLDYDVRDNIFTPNKGTQITSNFLVNSSWTGSDYNFQNFNVSVFQYFQTAHNLVSGFRLETNFQFGNAPFYAEKSIQMRGVPMARYQGTSIYTLATEQRYDFDLRWSGVIFGGLSKATTSEVKFDDATLVYSYGVGFRYLLARLFKLRAGIDVAKSNEDWGYYITIGSAWNNRN